MIYIYSFVANPLHMVIFTHDTRVITTIYLVTRNCNYLISPDTERLVEGIDRYMDLWSDCEWHQ